MKEKSPLPSKRPRIGSKSSSTAKATIEKKKSAATLGLPKNVFVVGSELSVMNKKVNKKGSNALLTYQCTKIDNGIALLENIEQRKKMEVSMHLTKDLRPIFLGMGAPKAIYSFKQ
jgi:hypothetical protein